MSVRQRIKSAMFALFPDTSLKLFSMRDRRSIERRASALGLDTLARAVARQTDGKVAGGPFAGMLIDYEALPVNSAPKFLGTYEREIAEFVEAAISQAPPVVLNVGASDGYYAVGLAQRLPAATVYAADADDKSLRATSRNAALNGVGDRVVAVGIVHGGEFATYLTQPAG